MKLPNLDIWITRDGRTLEISKMDIDHFHNLVVYIYTEGFRFNNPYLLRYEDRILKECVKRGLDLNNILKEGVRAYKDQMGLTRIWDEETNTELISN